MKEVGVEYRITGIKSWPEDDRPREKLFKQGEHKLSDTELLAIILRTGTKGQTAIDIARKIISEFKTFSDMSEFDSPVWSSFKGLGPAKMAQLRAAIEIGRRFREQQVKKNDFKISSSKDAADILMPRMGNLKKEIFKIMLLSSDNKLIDIIELAEGTIAQVNPYMREIFHKALLQNAAAIICAHNHPSGNVKPSKIDKNFTQTILELGKALHIFVLDHLIVSHQEYFSFADQGLI